MNDRELCALAYCLILATEGPNDEAIVTAWKEQERLWEAYNYAYK